MYTIICTRSYVSCALTTTICFLVNPRKNHWIVVKIILKYIIWTKDLFLVYGDIKDLSVKCYTKASFQNDIGDSHSYLEFVYMMNVGAVTWRSTKQSKVVDLMAKYEYCNT